MKELLTVLLAGLSLSAWADSYGMPNKAGGEIVLTTAPCPGYKHLMEAYNYTPGGKMQMGCWTVLEGQVQVVWNDKTRYVYPIDAFYVKHQDKKGDGI